MPVYCYRIRYVHNNREYGLSNKNPYKRLVYMDGSFFYIKDMWIKLNDRKFWLVRILEPVKYENPHAEYCRLVVRDRPKDEYAGVVDLYYDSNDVRYRQYIIRMYNPDTVFAVYDGATMSMAYSAISTRLALEEL